PGKNTGKTGKSREKPGKNGKIPGKSRENPGKNGKIPGKSRENPGKNGKIPGKTGKSGKSRNSGDWGEAGIGGELMVTELSHLRLLRALDVLFYQRLQREQLLSPHELGLLFPNLPDLIAVHTSLWESLKKLRDRGPIIQEIGDAMLARFEGDSKEEFQRVAAAFCSSQSVALELIRTKQRKESRFQLFIQEAESHPQCRRLQLKDLLVAETQRLSKYPLLLESLIRLTGSPEREKLFQPSHAPIDLPHNSPIFPHLFPLIFPIFSPEFPLNFP
uniref:DH domain-containing protein n=1 Tax=Cyanistes caeruleus TaxID=156563 RepID=A0A8C0U9U4_CYACU